MTTAAQAASEVTLPNAVTSEAQPRRRIDLAQEVIDLLAVALHRDDIRRQHRCPTCHRPLEDQS